MQRYAVAQGIMAVVLATVLWGGKAMANERPGVVARHEGSRLLKSGTLVAEVMDPGHPQRYNRGTRFTPVAAVLRVWHDGHEYLLNPVEHEPLTQVAGLMAEFDIASPDGPPGFAEAQVGEGFLKIGVGVLRRDEQARNGYRFWPQYEVIAAATTTVEWAADRARYRQRGDAVNGYACELSADVGLDGRRLTVAWTLANTGQKPFRTRHYAHNCFRFDDLNVGPDYAVDFPYTPKPDALSPQQAMEGRTLRYVTELPKPFNTTVPYPPDYEGSNELTIRHLAAGRSVTCSVSVPGLHTFVHASRDYLCPEQFVEIALEPGEKKTWTHTYVFGE